MSLSALQRDMEGCSRCSNCKWVPHLQIKSWRFAKVCPAVDRYHFHAYSGGGRMIMANSLLRDRTRLTEGMADVAYRCQLCGACQVSCQAYRDDIDLSDVLLALRSHCVEEGFLLAEHLDIMESMKREDNTLGEKKSQRGDWAEGLHLPDVNQEKVDVLFHAGCRFSYDEDLRETLRSSVRLLKENNVDVGIAGKDEACCGGRAFEIGFTGQMKNYAEDMKSRVRHSGATTLVTPCSDCYYTFKYLYPKNGMDLGVRVVHTVEYLDQLMKTGRIRPKKKVPMRVTWHDPCHLGRRGEIYKHWVGEDKLLRSVKFKQTGKLGVFEPPRDILRALPGVDFVEMERIREYSWCCGAGGGVLEAEPEFAQWTAEERLDEALATGAEAIVTACPWCERVFSDTIEETGKPIKVWDIADLVTRSMGG